LIANSARLLETIKRDFNRLGRHGSHGQNQTSRQNMPAPTNGSHESTPLIGRTYTDDNESRWKTLPKHIVHLTYATLTSNYVNVLLVFVPIGIIAGIMGWNPTAVFILNFIAIMPLAALLSFATEELSAKLGQTLGGLLNATFGNAVELIVSLAPQCAATVSDSHRSPLLRSSRAKLGLSSLACSAAFSPTSYS
jgi:Ca2+:H+ antiporter